MKIPHPRAASIVLLTFGIWLASCGPARAEESPTEPVVGDGSVVDIEYVLKDDQGNVLDASEEGKPLSFTQGRHQVIPGIEKALQGMHAGESKRFDVPPEEAYGVVDPNAQAEVPKTIIPAEAQTVGRRLVARGRDGESRVVRVKEIKDTTVVLDLNHPLAGQTLHFDVRVVKVQPAARP